MSVLPPGADMSMTGRFAPEADLPARSSFLTRNGSRRPQPAAERLCRRSDILRREGWSILLLRFALGHIDVLHAQQLNQTIIVYRGSKVLKGELRKPFWSARADNDGIVRLPDGAIVRAVEVIPAKLPLKPSELDWRIVHQVISIIGAEDNCYRSLREHAKPNCPDVSEEMISESRFIDCSTLKKLDLPSLKYITQQIGKRNPTLKKLSRQKVAEALRKFGMRIPTNLASAKSAAFSGGSSAITP
jgi:hypothetical protein